MRDPYETLGVSTDATDERVKAAYRDLAKKYHPDHFANDERARELAEEKMKEINEAYDVIMDQRRGGAGGAKSTAGSRFPDIRDLITANRIEEAMQRLDAVPIANRDAEWYFLSGSVQYKRGWFDRAYSNFATACRMDPNNREYRAALDQVQYSRRGYNPYRPGGDTSGAGANCSVCDVCAALVCCDTCCECMGGDLIGCC